MPTSKQIAANRRNAKLSTGPKTDAGKAIASQNALRHGVFALSEALLPWEAPEALALLYQNMILDWRPQGFMEEILVEKMTADIWKLRRLQRVESGVEINNSISVIRQGAEKTVSPGSSFLIEYVPSVFDEEREVPEAAPEEPLGKVPAYPQDLNDLGAAFVHDISSHDALGKVRRYQTALENSLYRAIGQLQRLQATRREVAPARDGNIPVRLSSSGDRVSKHPVKKVA